MDGKKLMVVAAAIVVVIVIAVFVWPTPYQHENLNLGIMGTQEVRTNRFTGEKEIHGGGKWQPISIEEGKVSVPEDTVIEVR